jgi:hypothetical protein
MQLNSELIMLVGLNGDESRIKIHLDCVLMSQTNELHHIQFPAWAP